jgi:transglutaminase-like putative cysteine protease
VSDDLTSVQWIPGGDAGVWLTLRKMRALVRAAVRDPLTIETAQRIVSASPPRDARAEVTALRAWLAAHFRFVADPISQETLRSPQRALAQYQRDGVVSGDCDDAAVLGAALAAAIGLRPYAVVTGFRRPGAPFKHVYTVVPVDAWLTEWVDLDVTRPAGMTPPVVTRSLGWQF